MKGELAPSSSETFLTVPAHRAISCLPASMLPVNETFLTSGLSSSAGISVSSSPVSTDRTPRGSPAFSASTQSASAENGACDAGLSTTVQPAASAAPILRATIDEGNIHDVIAAHTPTGCLITWMRWLRRAAGMLSP